MLVFDYNKAMAQVRELRAIAADMLRSQTLSNAIEGAKNAWQGQTADSFLEKCMALDVLIRKEAKSIADVADSLERTARIIDEAERAALNVLTGGLAKK